MKIDFDAVIVNAAGEPMTDIDRPTAVVTLATIASSSLFASLPDDQSLEPARKAEYGALGIQLFAGGAHDLKVEQIALLKDRIGRTYAPLVVARAFDLLDPADASA